MGTGWRWYPQLMKYLVMEWFTMSGSQFDCAVTRQCQHERESWADVVKDVMVLSCTVALYRSLSFELLDEYHHTSSLQRVEHGPRPKRFGSHNLSFGEERESIAQDLRGGYGGMLRRSQSEYTATRLPFSFGLGQLIGPSFAPKYRVDKTISATLVPEIRWLLLYAARRPMGIARQRMRLAM